MSPSPDSRESLARLRSDLAGLTLDAALLRAEHALRRKYRPDQPRAPAGGPEGGRWVSEGGRPSLGARWTSGGGDPLAETMRLPEVTNDDGARVLTIRVRANASVDWDEQHRVVTPDGTATLFENSGLTQTVRDGETGEILARSRLTREGAVPEAFVQSARGPAVPGDRVARTFDAAATLFGYLAEQGRRYGIPFFAAPASEYKPGEGEDAVPIWVGRVSQADLDAACPRNGEVQMLADQMAAQVQASGGFLSEQDYGNKVHLLIAQEINSRNDPNFVAEKAYERNKNPSSMYGPAHSIRLDVLENVFPSTVCVYDHKTGKRGLRQRRVLDIMTVVKRNFPGAKRLIMIEVRPRQ